VFWLEEQVFGLGEKDEQISVINFVSILSSWLSDQTGQLLTRFIVIPSPHLSDIDESNLVQFHAII